MKIGENMNEKKQPGFEESLKQLEEIVTQIEQGKISLEESIEKYAQGIELIRKCRATLNEAEKKITLLSQNENGSLSVGGELEEQNEPF